MNKKYFKFFAIILVAVSFFAIFAICQFDGNLKKVYAQDEVETTTITADDDLLDATLFERLVKFYNDNLPDGKTRVKNLSTDMFLDEHFDGMTLDLSGNDQEKIIYLRNLNLFDLSKFAKVDLSKNAILEVTDVFKNASFDAINLSDNYIQLFDCLDVNYLKLQNLDLSFNLLVDCNLQHIATIQSDVPENQTATVVNLQDNFLDSAHLTLPDDETVEVYASHNLLKKEEVLKKLQKQELPSTIHLGFQGPKRNANYKASDAISLEFFGFDEVTEIVLQKADTSGLSTNQVMDNIGKYKPAEYQTLQTLSAGDTFVFDSPGYYNIVFADDVAEKTGLKVDLYFYVKPDSPKFEIYQNGQKIDYTGKVNQEVEIKVLDASPDVTYVFKNNLTSEWVVGDSLKVSTAGGNYFYIYQIVDGCISDGKYVSVNYQKSVAYGWTYILIGIGVFGALGYVLYISIPKIATIGLRKKGNRKKNLD